MPLISDPAAEENLAVLRTYVEKCGGEGSAIAGWTTELYSRSIGNSAGTTDRYFFDTTGKKFRSRAEIVRALGLSGAPAIRVKGDGSTSTGVLRPGEQPATFGFEWDRLSVVPLDAESGNAPVPAQSPAEMFDGRPHGQAPLPQNRTFGNAARVFKIAGDFREFDGKDAMGAEVSQMYRRQPKRWRDVLENAYVWPAKRDPQPPSCEWSKCNCTYADGGCGADCVNRELYVECPLDCCGGGAPDPACESKEAAAPEKLDAAGTDAPFAVGAFINVKADTSPGHNREGGAGTIMALNEYGTFDIKAAIGRNLWQNVKREDLSREQTPRRSLRSRRSGHSKEESSRRNGGGGRLPCSNTVIQRRAYPPVEVFDTGTIGFGLRGRVAIAREQKIGEYRGEVVDQNELLERRCNRKAEDPFYIAALGDGLSIDAGHRGAYARFANHSCGPNCKLEKWRVGEEPRLVLVALRDVPPGEELTYDYNAGGTEADTTVGQECMCGAPNCLGAIGSKKHVVKGRGYASDSDDEGTKRAARASRRRGEKPVNAEKPATGRAEPVWTLEDVMALEEGVEVLGSEDWDLVLEKSFPGSRRTPAQLENKYKELHAHKKPAPKDKRPKKKQKLQKDGPESTAWAAQTHLVLLGSKGGALELAEALYSAATRNAERRAGGELHCYCRLPEFPEAPCVSTDGDAAELLFCDACAGWVHPRCIRLESMPGDDEDYACPLCAHSRGDGAPLATVAQSNGKTLWTRALGVFRTLSMCEACLELWDDAETDDGLLYAGLAKFFLETLVSEAKDFDARAAPFLATKAALSPGELRGLAELVCEGQTLELVDAATLDALRDALRGAALAAGEMPPET